MDNEQIAEMKDDCRNCSHNVVCAHWIHCENRLIGDIVSLLNDNIGVMMADCETDERVTTFLAETLPQYCDCFTPGVADEPECGE